MDLYGVPVLDEAELNEYFTFNPQEIKALRSFKEIRDAVYFAISLVFFKIKKTWVNFQYQETTVARQHVMKRYFPTQAVPRSLPNQQATITRIENKVLLLCGYQRYTEKIKNKIIQELKNTAADHPRQRQICKALLDGLTKHRVAIPGYTTLQNIVSFVWNDENDRVIQSYLRHTSKKQRNAILSLLGKTDHIHVLINIKQDMKSFNTHDLWNEIEKHDQIKPIFEIGLSVLPKLHLPKTTIDYYAHLIYYYTGSRLKKISQEAAGLYILCYSYTRYQVLNDNLIEAFKKRTLEYKAKAKEYAKEQALKQMDYLTQARKNVSELLITIKNYPHPTHIPKQELYNHVPENDLLIVAALLMSENLNKKLLFWKYIDSIEEAIKINLRPLFLAIDFNVTNDDLLKEAISYIKTGLTKKSLSEQPLPSSLQDWISEKQGEYLFHDKTPIANRFEFLLYMKMIHSLSTNRLSLKHSIKYKDVNDDLLPKKDWNENKKKILKKLDYPKLSASIKNTLKIKKDMLEDLFETVNDAIKKGDNKQIKLTTTTNGAYKWRLRPLDPGPDPNQSLFLGLQQRPIAEIMYFVDKKTKFTRFFEPILPRSKKGDFDSESIMAVILANALRMGSRKMSNSCDINESALLTAESAYIRLETLLPAIDAINNEAAKLPIFKEWYINSILHGSLDGMKIETSLRTIKSRFSNKYFGNGVGVSAYNEIFNCFSIASRLIGTNEYEGNFAFEMVHHQNTSIIKPSHISTDKHGMNSLNFGLFDLTDKVFAPRIPKPHREILWGFGKAENYEGLIIKPTRFVDENFIFEEWDNMQHLVASLLVGTVNPSIAIRKLAAKDYFSKTKKAFVQYNHLVRTQHILEFLHDPKFRRSILYALNRGEGYNNLYQAITILNKGELRGQNEVEMEIWNQCTRLISSVILYYNTYILNSLYLNAKTDSEREFLCSFSPAAWVHINLLGHYQFCRIASIDWLDQWLRGWDWKKMADFVGKI